MNWLDKLQRKYGRYGIDNLTRYLIIFSLIGYILETVGADTVLDALAFSPALILRGQIWRLVTWVISPSTSGSFLLLLFLLCLLMLGSSLERGLGAFRMTVYYIGGVLISDIGGILVYLLFHVNPHITMYYVLFSLYLMLGLFMPDAEVRLYFVLPIKMKWMMIFYAVTLGYELINYFVIGYQYFGFGTGMLAVGFAYGGEMIFALINLFVFVRAVKRRPSMAQKARQQKFQREFKAAEPRQGSGIARHKCCVCGKTDVSNPEMLFRYCSKCAGNREYCEEHLYTHQHVQ